jgi:hypothetical protein
LVMLSKVCNRNDLSSYSLVQASAGALQHHAIVRPLAPRDTPEGAVLRGWVCTEPPSDHASMSNIAGFHRNRHFSEQQDTTYQTTRTASRREPCRDFRRRKAAWPHHRRRCRPRTHEGGVSTAARRHHYIRWRRIAN